MKSKQYSVALISSLSLLLPYHAQASGGSLLLNYVGQYVVQAKPLDAEFVPTEQDQLKEAKFNSGLGLALSNPLFDVTVDYRFKGNLQREDDSDQGTLSQTVSASMSSALLNDILAVDAKISADSAVVAGGDVYHYNISPGFSRSIYNFADVDVKYNYKLAKPSAVALIEESKGYSLGLKGTLQKGRLVWKGLYSESSLFQDQLLKTESTEVIDFNSRYRLVTDLHLELSSAIKNRTILDGVDNRVVSEKRFRAGISWSPTEQYSFALKCQRNILTTVSD